jgi:hypothetical protein
MKLTISLTVIAALLALAVFLWPPSNVSFYVRASGDPKGARQLKLLSDGQVTGTFSQSYIDTEVVAKRRVWELSMPVFGIELLTPCGWQPADVKSSIETTVDPQSKQTRAYTKLEYLGPNESMTLYVDNRDRPGMTLSVGQNLVAIPANSRETTSTGIPTCDEGAIIRIDGNEVGRIPLKNVPSKGENPEARATWLVDPTGARCYHYKLEQYSPTGRVDYAGEEFDLRRSRLHSFTASVNHFLEEAPKSISIAWPETPRPDGGVGRGVLSEVPCE